MQLMTPNDMSVLTILARHTSIDKATRIRLVKRLESKLAKDVAVALTSPKKAVSAAARDEAEKLRKWADTNEEYLPQSLGTL